MATQEQHNQLVAMIATLVKPSDLGDAEDFQELIGAPSTFAEEFGKLLREWEPSSRIPSIIQTSTLPQPTFPDWSLGKILRDVVSPKTFDVNRLMKNAWQHANQTGDNQRPTGHEILATLVKSYVVREDKAGMTYQVQPTDLINRHFGLRELLWLENNWKTLPRAFRKWAKGKWLDGWVDVVRDDVGYLRVPYLFCDVPTPFVYWCNLGSRWVDYEFALREQVSPQS